jgi:hypothetical protein
MAQQILNAIKSLYKDTINIKPYSSSDLKGVRSYGSSVAYKARVIGQHNLVKDATGKEVMSTVVAWINANTGITVRDHFTLPSRFSPNTPECLKVEFLSDENGAHHIKVYFK